MEGTHGSAMFPSARAIVFIVGLPRTGTHLMRSILNSSPEVGIGHESHFLGGAPRFGLVSRPGFAAVLAAAGNVAQQDGARRVVERLWERGSGPIRQMHFWRAVVCRGDPDAFLAQLLAVPRRDERHVLALAMAWSSDSRPVWGDKTPSHLYHVPRLLAWYPQAKVLHMIRDPRAVYVSERERSWVGLARLRLRKFPAVARLAEAGFATDVGIRWRLAARLDLRYRRAYAGRYLACQFERLLADPEKEIRRVCHLIGVAFDPGMLEQKVTASSLGDEGKPGFRAEHIDAWRAPLSPTTARLIRWTAGPAMARYGYRG